MNRTACVAGAGGAYRYTILPDEDEGNMVADFPQYDAGLKDEGVLEDMDFAMRTRGEFAP